MAEEEKATDKATTNTSGWSVKKWAPDWITPAGVPIVVAVLYGGLRAATASFYDAFGLTPEDVGLNYASVLARSMMGLVVSAGVVASFLGLTWALRRRVPSFDTMGRFVEGSTWYGSIARVAVFVVIALVATAALLAVQVGLVLIWEPLGEIVPIVTVIVFAASGVRTMVEDPAISAAAAKFRPLAIYLVGAYLVLGAIPSFISTAKDDAKSVKAGTAPTSSWFGVSLYPWDATASCVVIPDDTRKASRGCNGIPGGRSRRCVMFLGENSAAVYVFDPVSRYTLRLPPSTVVELLPDAKCPRNG